MEGSALSRRYNAVHMPPPVQGPGAQEVSGMSHADGSHGSSRTTEAVPSGFRPCLPSPPQESCTPPLLWARKNACALTAAPAYPRAGGGPGRTPHHGTCEAPSGQQRGLSQVPALQAESKQSVGSRPKPYQLPQSDLHPFFLDVRSWTAAGARPRLGWATAATKAPGNLGSSFIRKLWHCPLELTPD